MSDEKVVKPKFLGYFASWQYENNSKSAGHFLANAALLAEWLRDEADVSEIVDIKSVYKSKASFKIKDEEFHIEGSHIPALENVVKRALKHSKFSLDVNVVMVYESDEKVRLY